jgi:glycosyltransferase involved in cell wall biosynthesis
VVALRRGSVPEVILHGRTGFVCRDETELPDAIAEAATLNPADCVAHVRASFSVDLMAQRYERVYRRLIGERTRRGAPVGPLGASGRGAI